MKLQPGSSVRLGVLLLFVFIGGCGTPTPEADLSWNKQFDRQLARMGKNNWIVISDAASSRKHVVGTEILVTHKPLPSVLDFVLSRLTGSDRVYATAWISSELEHIPDRDALNITQLNRDIRRLLNVGKVEAKVAPEEEILKKLESDAGTYNVLILKTDTPLPYSSVYLQLDSRYWDDAREKRLRDALRGLE
jgi:hypothetical protein